ncbi:glutamate 5-kinase [Nitrincola tapanii]|uniref:Glutamate 5-kinase n=1 Tax=Nitrincola tapanii TaxID=1708751 RepID=A0A5A9W6I9_9GAMM|nr:glutamate 5-kinase [Nitrincola tapanii]KAA0876326.1 glutamate 5-kinase [Nitrincola tapanii]
MASGREQLQQAGRWVVKIGSALLTDDGRGLDEAAIGRWVDQLVALRQSGVEIILVSSGAVAEGMTRLGWTQRPDEIYRLQAAAAVGQMGLVQAWEAQFQRHAIHTAQVLLTHDDLSNRKRYLNARATLRTLIELGVVAVVNENDTVVTSEIRFGDNDTLGALVANAVEADALILLTDQSGLYDADPRSNPQAQLISDARAEDDWLQEVAGDGGRLGRGGMATKVRAARLAARSGAVTAIASGREVDVLLKLHRGDRVGTVLVPDREPMAARKQWIAGHLQARGTLIIDEGAVKALTAMGKSLLPAGVLSVSGDFSRGEMVIIADRAGRIVARGLVNYGLEDAQKLLGRPTREIESLLGFVGEAELVHRDNMVVA